MHYYKFNIADYRKDTAHLTPIEHYIYRQLIDWYYLDEKPIPKETQSVIRRLSLGMDMVNHLDNVLNDFFVEEESGWSHKRIDAEIEQYHEKAETNAKNGKKGGRPKKQQLTDDEKPEKTQSVISGNRAESEKKPNHKPLTINQEPIDKENTIGNSGAVTDCPHDEIISLYHELLPVCPQVRVWTDKRKKMLRARWREDTKRQNVEWWKKYFSFVASCDFLVGKGGGERPFFADLEWLVNPSNMVKVIEGKYQNAQ